MITYTILKISFTLGLATAISLFSGEAATFYPQEFLFIEDGPEAY
jgi:hypothetical protein